MGVIKGYARSLDCGSDGRRVELHPEAPRATGTRQISRTRTFIVV